MKKTLLSLLIAGLGAFTYAQCDPVTGINEDFNDIEGQALPECWSQSHPYPNIYLDGEDDKYINVYSFFSGGTTLTFITPELVNEAGEYTLSFDAGPVSGSAPGTTTLVIGTVDSPDNLDSFASLGTSITLTSSIDTYSYNYTLNGSEGKYIAFRVTHEANHQVAAFDNIIWQSSLNTIDTATKVKVSAYPNPVINELNLQAETSIKDVKIFDISGKLLSNVRPENTSSKINFSSFSKGVYIVSVTTANGTENFKIVKK